MKNFTFSEFKTTLRRMEERNLIADEIIFATKNFEKFSNNFQIRNKSLRKVDL